MTSALALFVQAQFPYFPQKGFRPMSDNAPYHVIGACIIPVTTQLSAKQRSLRKAILWDLLHVYADKKENRKELVTSILAYLASVEDAERDPWLKDDLRISWLTVLYAYREYQQPHVAATYQVLGLHPDKLAAAIEARRAALIGQPSPASPKKRPRKVTPLVQKAAAGGD